MLWSRRFVEEMEKKMEGLAWENKSVPFFRSFACFYPLKASLY